MNTKPYIKKLSATGLKAGDFSHDLGPVTLFKGRSGSGKTSRLNALRLALCGQDPTVGRLGAKTGAAIMDLARGTKLTVHLEDNRGQTITRAWQRKGKSVTTLPVEGDIPATPTVLIDPEEYFGLTDTKKIEYVFGLCAIEESAEFSGEGIVARIKNLSLPENNEHTVAKVRELAAEIDQSDTIRHEAGETIQAWLQSTIADLKERLKTEKATCDRMTKTVHGLTQIGATEMPLNYGAEIAAKRKAMDEIQKTIGGLQEQLRALGESRKATAKKVQSLREKLTELEPVEVPDNSAKIAELEKRLREMTPDQSAIELVAAKIADHKAMIASLSKDVKLFESRTVMRMAQLNTVKNELSQLTARRDERKRQIEKMDASLADKLARPCCPECGTPTESIRDRVMKKHEEEVQELNELIAHDGRAISASLKEVEKAEKRLIEAQSADTANSQKVTRIAEIQCEINDIQERQAKSAIERHAKDRTIRQQIAALEQSVRKAKDQNADNDRLKAGLTEAQAELERLGAQGNIEVEMTAAQVELNRRELELSTLEDQQRAYQRAKDDEQRNAAALVEHAKSQASCEVLKATIETLEDVQTRMVETAFSRLLATVNKFTLGSVMTSPIEYRDGELGYFRGSTWVSHRTFSGTEKAMTYAGLAAALAESAPVVVVTLDELGVMDYASLTDFMNRMVKLVGEGLIGQFIGCWSNDGATDFSLPGVTAIAV